MSSFATGCHEVAHRLGIERVAEGRVHSVQADGERGQIAYGECGNEFGELIAILMGPIAGRLLGGDPDDCLSPSDAERAGQIVTGLHLRREAIQHAHQEAQRRVHEWADDIQAAARKIGNADADLGRVITELASSFSVPAGYQRVGCSFF